MKIYIREQISKNRFITPEGYLICRDVILARTGEQIYKHSELYEDSTSDEEVLIQREESEVFSPKAMASFENKPITIHHPKENVNPDNWKALSYGIVRDIHKGQDPETGEPVMMGNFVVMDQEAIDAIQSGEMTDVSCGYDCDIQDNKFVDIMGNHVALCYEGRAGNARVQDTNDGWEQDFEKIISRYEGYTSSQKNIAKKIYEEETENEVHKYLQGLGLKIKDSLVEDEEIIYTKTYKGNESKEIRISNGSVRLNYDEILNRTVIRFLGGSRYEPRYDITVKGKITSKEQLLREIKKHVKDINDAKRDITSEIDLNNIVQTDNGYWARKKGESNLLTVAYYSPDKKEWYKASPNVVRESVNTKKGKLQVGKINFYNRKYNKRIGRNVLTWYTANGGGRTQKGYHIDHINGDYTDDRLSNLEKVTEQENARRREVLKASKKDSVKCYEVLYKNGPGLSPLYIPVKNFTDEYIVKGMKVIGDEDIVQDDDLSSLKGKTISKNRIKSKQPGGLEYEANKLGIDMWKLLDLLEAGLRSGRVIELDDSTYKVKDELDKVRDAIDNYKVKDDYDYKGYVIKYVRGHYEAFKNGVFVISGDTLREVEKDLDEM